jgi:hypothetical protein
MYAVPVWNLGKPLSFFLKTEKNRENRSQDGRVVAWRKKTKKEL